MHPIRALATLLPALLAAALPAAGQARVAGVRAEAPVAGSEAGGRERAAVAVVTRRVAVMGTRLDVAAEAPTRRAAMLAAEAAVAEVERLDALLSTWKADSPLSRANAAPRGMEVALPAELARLLVEADDWARRTGRAFEPRVGALVDAWDLRGAGREPPPPGLARALQAVSPGAIELVEGRPGLVRRDERAWIDAGAFGKGAALRAASAAVMAAGATAIVLDLGGQVAVAGERRGGFPVAVAHPSRRGEGVAHLLLSDASAATSGTSERWIEVDGRRLGHLLDPRTGRPVPAWGSVTVVSGDPLVADVLATALYVMGPDLGFAWVEARPDVGALFLVERDGAVLPRWNAAMERWLDPDGPLGAEPR